MILFWKYDKCTHKSKKQRYQSEANTWLFTLSSWIHLWKRDDYFYMINLSRSRADDITIFTNAFYKRKHDARNRFFLFLQYDHKILKWSPDRFRCSTDFGLYSITRTLMSIKKPWSCKLSSRVFKKSCRPSFSLFRSEINVSSHNTGQ